MGLLFSRYRRAEEDEDFCLAPQFPEVLFPAPEALRLVQKKEGQQGLAAVVSPRQPEDLRPPDALWGYEARSFKSSQELQGAHPAASEPCAQQAAIVQRGEILEQDEKGTPLQTGERYQPGVYICKLLVY